MNQIAGQKKDASRSSLPSRGPQSQESTALLGDFVPDGITNGLSDVGRRIADAIPMNFAAFSSLDALLGSNDNVNGDVEIQVIEKLIAKQFEDDINFVASLTQEKLKGSEGAAVLNCIKSVQKQVNELMTKYKDRDTNSQKRIKDCMQQIRAYQTEQVKTQDLKNKVDQHLRNARPRAQKAGLCLGSIVTIAVATSLVAGVTMAAEKHAEFPKGVTTTRANVCITDGDCRGDGVQGVRITGGTHQVVSQNNFTEHSQQELRILSERYNNINSLFIYGMAAGLGGIVGAVGAGGYLACHNGELDPTMSQLEEAFQQTVQNQPRV